MLPAVIHRPCSCPRRFVPAAISLFVYALRVALLPVIPLALSNPGNPGLSWLFPLIGTICAVVQCQPLFLGSENHQHLAAGAGRFASPSSPGPRGPSPLRFAPPLRPENFSSKFPPSSSLLARTVTITSSRQSSRAGSLSTLSQCSADCDERFVLDEVRRSQAPLSVSPASPYKFSARQPGPHCRKL